MVVIDPPFITRDVWEKYAKTAYYLLKLNTTAIRILCTTVYENASMMDELFGAKSQVLIHISRTPNVYIYAYIYIHRNSCHLFHIWCISITYT